MECQRAGVNKVVLGSGQNWKWPFSKLGLIRGWIETSNKAENQDSKSQRYETRQGVILLFSPIHFSSINKTIWKQEHNVGTKTFPCERWPFAKFFSHIWRTSSTSFVCAGVGGQAGRGGATIKFQSTSRSLLQGTCVHANSCFGPLHCISSSGLSDRSDIQSQLS